VIPAYTWYALPSGALTFVNERTADYLGRAERELRDIVDTIPAIVRLVINRKHKYRGGTKVFPRYLLCSRSVGNCLTCVVIAQWEAFS
jgi:hypothetical protein